MSTMIAGRTTTMTAEELLDANIKQRCELVKGELRLMSPAGGEHGWVIMNVAAPLDVFVKNNKLGYVFGAETGFIIDRDPDTVRAPDVAFIRTERLEGRISKKFIPGPPDLAVEVISPDDTASEVQEKTEQWLRCGCQEVWLVDPQRNTASRCTLRDAGVLIETVEVLTSNMLPGFRLPTGELFQ